MNKRPAEVFTPRSAKVNDRMYVERPELEKRLRDALRGTQHILIHGESGSGKSWLYKRVLATDQVKYEGINLANASSFGSLRDAFKDAVERTGHSQRTSFTNTKQGAVDFKFFSGQKSHQDSYNIGQMEPFELCLKYLSDRASGNRAVIVLDNLEEIHSNEMLMNELGNIIILLDDERYAKYNVKFIIVGVPAGVREYYRKLPNRQTVANRLVELPEVARLTDQQCGDLIHRGFIVELGCKLSSDVFSEVSKHAAYVTDRVPQRLHEWCLGLAELTEYNHGHLDLNLLEEADEYFLSRGLSDDYETVFYLMNEPSTKIGRRNQLLYALGTFKRERITVAEIEAEVRKQFPNTTSGKKLNISKLMNELSSGKVPIIRRVPKGDAFAFSDPRYRMCIRAMLKKDSKSEKVRAINLGSI